jgi:hypothetical protein
MSLSSPSSPDPDLARKTSALKVVFWALFTSVALTALFCLVAAADHARRFWF